MDDLGTSNLWLVPLDLTVFGHVQQFVDQFLVEQGVDAKAAYTAQLVIEEIVRNLIQHTPPYSTDETVEIAVGVAPDNVTVEISDTRPPFDPSAAPPLEVDSSLEERRPGGMGIHLVRNMVDELTYRRDDDRNRLTAVIARE